MTHLTMYSGDTKRLVVTVRRGNGDPVDLGGAAIRWQLAKRARPPALLQKSLGSGIEPTDPEGGVFTVVLEPSDTAMLGSRDYYHEAEIVDALGNVATVLSGRITVVSDLIE